MVGFLVLAAALARAPASRAFAPHANCAVQTTDQAVEVDQKAAVGPCGVKAAKRPPD